MKQVLIDRYGPPEEVARCAEMPDVGAPGAGEAQRGARTGKILVAPNGAA